MYKYDDSKIAPLGPRCGDRFTDQYSLQSVFSQEIALSWLSWACGGGGGAITWKAMGRTLSSPVA